jgi:hypothetical protein
MVLTYRSELSKVWFSQWEVLAIGVRIAAKAMNTQAAVFRNARFLDRSGGGLPTGGGGGRTAACPSLTGSNVTQATPGSM